MDPRCERCIATFAAAIIFVGACPLPHNDECPYKRRITHEHTHHEMYEGPPVENPTMTIASTAASIYSPYVISSGPDPNIEGNKIYYVNVTATPTT